MAYTKIHAVTAAVNKAVDYTCSPAKIDKGILIFSYGYGSEATAYDFRAYIKNDRLAKIILHGKNSKRYY